FDRRRQGPAQRRARCVWRTWPGAAPFVVAGEAGRRDLSPRRFGANPLEPALGRTAAAAICPRRGAPVRTALSSHSEAEKAYRRGRRERRETKKRSEELK